MWGFTDSVGRLTPDVANTANALRDHPPDRVTLAGAMNETLGFSFAIQPVEADIENPTLRVTPPSIDGEVMDASTIMMYQRHAVAVDRWPGWHIRAIPVAQRVRNPFDVLVPLSAPRGGLPRVMRVGRTYRFWVDMAIPSGIRDGHYHGKIALWESDHRIRSLDIDLTVWPFVLPDESDVDAVVELDHHELFRHHIRSATAPFRLSMEDWRTDPKRRELDALLTSTLAMLRDHRLTPVLPRLAPVVSIDARARVHLNWEAFDAVVGPCLSGELFSNRKPLSCWPLPLAALSSAHHGRASLVPAAYRALRSQFLRLCARHFKEQGWLARSYALSPDFSPGDGKEAVTSERRFVEDVRRASRAIPIVSHLFPQDMEPLGWPGFPRVDFGSSVDIWMPLAQFYDEETMARARAGGKRTWLAVDRPPFSGTVALGAPKSFVRELAWQADAAQAEVLFLGGINRWPDAKADPTAEDCVRHDPHVLLYPGRPFGLDKPVPSVRLKYLRRSLQDVAYHRLLREHGLEHVFTAMQQSLVAYAGSDAYRTHYADGRSIGWVREDRLYEAARQVMAEELIRKAVRPEENCPSETFARNMTWRKIASETRRIDVHVEGVRVRLAQRDRRGVAQVECAIQVMNRKRVSVAGSIRWVDLPEGWHALSARPVVSLAPHTSRVVTISAETSTLPVKQGGVLLLSLQWTTDHGVTIPFHARVAVIAAARLDTKIEIDGDLSDWPAGTTNVASGFVSIADGANQSTGESPSSPPRSTTAFVMRDRHNLYVAVNAELDPSSRRPTSRQKAVNYKDLIPTGEELVEILIDPLNSGSRSPTDLYHLVVKYTGSDREERGVLCHPPCGVREPWSVDVDVATQITPGRWTAEARIPLASFGPVASEGVIWGFNITRFDAPNQEFSTWSGASPNAYDPLSLGNLYLPSVASPGEGDTQSRWEGRNR